MRRLIYRPAVLVSAACAVLTFAAPARATDVLADPARMIETARRMDFVGQNVFTTKGSTEGLMLRSTPQRSASGLYQRVDVGVRNLRPVTWRWRVDRLQASADIRNLATEDCGATIFFIFGEPSMSNKDVPTLAYTWTATPVADGTVLRSLRSNKLRYIQLRGRGEVGAWQRERRDLVEDYRAAFGSEPGTLVYVAIFNDNDQTLEPTSALFGAIKWVR
jgi:hypothetical protein